MIKIRQHLLDIMRDETEEKVAVLLSGGVDSLIVAFALRELGKDVHCYTFCLDGVMSTDFSRARSISRRFDFEFTPVWLPSDLATLKRDCRKLRSYGAIKKTDYECGWPVMRALQEITEKVIFTGHGSDAYFGLSKKAMMHYKQKMDQFRSDYFSQKHKCQQNILNPAAIDLGKRIEMPFLHPSLLPIFQGNDWESLNRPKEKYCIRTAYPEFKKMKLAPHTNLQMGDSGIAEHFKILLRSDWNTRKSKSVTGIYNDLKTGRIK